MKLKENITVFFKAKDKIMSKVVTASVRENITNNRSSFGLSESSTVLIRIFSTMDYLETWTINNGDIIVRGVANEDINGIDAPMTFLQEKYGKYNVYKVNEVQDNIYGSSLDHIKIGAI